MAGPKRQKMCSGAGQAARTPAGRNRPEPPRANTPRGSEPWVWAVRVALMLVTPLVVLGAIEAGLRLFGYGYPTGFLVPAEGTAGYTPNEKFLRRFYPHREAIRGSPFIVMGEKASNSFRVFILGESAALGTPNPAFGFGRILEVLVKEQFPNRQIEIYNAALRGVNSHIILPIARECARFSPDLVVIYMGNNEMVGLHGARPESNFVDRHLALIRLSHGLKGTRLGQLVSLVLSRTEPPKQDMAFFRAQRIALDDPRREPVYSHFQSNLEAMLTILHSAGAQVLLCTVPSNLADCPPVGSIDDPTCPPAQRTEWESALSAGIAATNESQVPEAVRHFERARAIDGRSANLHYRLGQSYARCAEFAKAREEFRLARDWDALPLRADSRLNEIIRETAGRFARRGVILVDAERIFEKSSTNTHGIPGRQLFTDHVHLRFAGDYLVAQALYSAGFETNSASPGRTAQPQVTLQECADQLGFNDWEALEIEAAALQQISRPPFLDWIDHKEIVDRIAREVKLRQENFRESDLRGIKRSSEAALGRRPDDWQLHLNYGVFLMTVGDAARAVPHLEVPVRLFPAQTPFRIRLADALAHAGRHGEAIEQLREVVRRDPDSKVAADALRALTGAVR